MGETEKSKAQLLAELQALRAQVTQLEVDQSNRPKRRTSRFSEEASQSTNRDCVGWLASRC